MITSENKMKPVDEQYMKNSKELKGLGAKRRTHTTVKVSLFYSSAKYS